MDPPDGIPIAQWFSSTFLDPDRPALQLLSRQFDLLQQEKKKAGAPPPPLTNSSGRPFVVNAQVIEGYKGRRYIACRGPNKSSVYDFYEVVWQQGVGAIVMANGLELLNPNPKHTEDNKIIQYWPVSKGAELQFLPWKVKCHWSKLKLHVKDKAEHAVEDTEAYIYRLSRLSLTNANMPGETRTLLHLCHFRWPDGKLPLPSEFATDALATVNLVRKELHYAPRGPVLVHCHAGIGRTGTLIVADIAASRLLNSTRADVIETVRKVREQRQGLVMNRWQYAFIHVALSYLAMDHMEKEMLPATDQKPSREVKADAVVSLSKCWGEMGVELLAHVAEKEKKANT